MFGKRTVTRYISLHYYKQFFKYRPSTPLLLGKKIKIKDIKELKKTFNELKPPKVKFEHAMQREGILESDLPSSHKKYNFILSFLFFISFYPIILSTKALIHKLQGGEFTFGFIPSLLTPLFFLVFTTLFYFFYSWIQWRIRNRMLITPLDYIKVIKTYPFEVLPMTPFNATMSKRYGIDWKQKIGKKNKKVKMKKEEDNK